MYHNQKVNNIFGKRRRFIYCIILYYCTSHQFNNKSSVDEIFTIQLILLHIYVYIPESIIFFVYAWKVSFIRNLLLISLLLVSSSSSYYYLYFCFFVFMYCYWYLSKKILSNHYSTKYNKKTHVQIIFKFKCTLHPIE